MNNGYHYSLKCTTNYNISHRSQYIRVIFSAPVKKKKLNTTNSILSGELGIETLIIHMTFITIEIYMEIRTQTDRRTEAISSFNYVEKL